MITYEEALEFAKNWKAPKWEDCKYDDGKPCYICKQFIKEENRQ